MVNFQEELTKQLAEVLPSGELLYEAQFLQSHRGYFSGGTGLSSKENAYDGDKIAPETRLKVSPRILARQNCLPYLKKKNSDRERARTTCCL